MKHNSHIYIAAKAIELLREAASRLRTPSGRLASARTRRDYAAKAKRLQRLLRFHEADILEASWAPDDILHDQRRFHTFKLFTDETLPEGADAYTAQTFRRADPRTGEARTYRRGPGAGGLPYRVDHLAALVADMRRLRAYNDCFSMRQLNYLYLLISHYVVDAHVPMHCDLRDDPPAHAKPDPHGKPGPRAAYFPRGLHARVEQTWDRAVTPVALAEGILLAERYADCHQETELSDAVRFDLGDRATLGQIEAVRIPDGRLMDWMTERCIETFEVSRMAVGQGGAGDGLVTPEVTRERFLAAITGLVGVWLAI